MHCVWARTVEKSRGGAGYEPGSALGVRGHHCSENPFGCVPVVTPLALLVIVDPLVAGMAERD